METPLPPNCTPHFALCCTTAIARNPPTCLFVLFVKNFTIFDNEKNSCRLFSDVSDAEEDANAVGAREQSLVRDTLTRPQAE